MNKEVQESLLRDMENLEPIKVTDSKEIIKEKLQKQGDVLRRIYTQDAFQNQMARLGFGQNNLTEGTEYPNTRMTYNFNLFNSLYRSSWIARKIIDVMPSDMLKNWIKFTTVIEPDDLRKIDSVLNKTRTKTKIKEGLKWGRLYGGAAGLILIEGDEDLSKPLDYSTIRQGSYKGMIIFDRWSGINPQLELEDDINDIEFGLPKYYDISLAKDNIANHGIDYVQNKSSLLKVHHSRIIRFEGRDLPYWEKQYETHWGESELEIVFEELKKRDNTSFNIASLIFLANIRILKMNDLGQLLGASSQQAQQNLYQTLTAQNELMNNMGIYVMDKDDDFDTKEYSFGGLNDIYESFMLDIAGACEMPVTKLFGRNPAGFNATGEGDLTQYYDTIEEKQETFLKPILDKLLPIIFMSAIGSVPEDLTWEFNPCRSISNEDLADLSQKMTSVVLDAFNAGLITKAVALRELKQQSDKTGMWSNITDELIEKAEQEDDDNLVTEEDQQNIISEMQSGSSDLTPDESNEQNNINNKEQHKDAIQANPEPQNDMKKYGWRDRIMDIWRMGS